MPEGKEIEESFRGGFAWSGIFEVGSRHVVRFFVVILHGSVGVQA